MCYNRHNGDVGDKAKSDFVKYKKEFAQGKVYERKIEECPSRKRSASEGARGSSPKRKFVENRRHTISSTPTMPDYADPKEKVDAVVEPPQVQMSKTHLYDKASTLKYNADTESEQSENDDDVHVPRKVVATTTFEGDVSQQPADDDVLSCPSSCDISSPPRQLSPVKPAKGPTGQAVKTTSSQLEKATDDLNRTIFQRLKCIEDHHVILDVGGELFHTSTSTLQYDPSSPLAVFTNRR